MKFNESINSSNNNNNSSTLQSGNLINNASRIVNFINEQENATMVKIIEQFNNLNQNHLKIYEDYYQLPDQKLIGVCYW